MAKIGRNAPCPCGSGKKYKKCCLGKDEFKSQRELQAESRRYAVEHMPPSKTASKPAVHDRVVYDPYRPGADTLAARYQVWLKLRERITPDMSSVKAAEPVFDGADFLFNWLQDFQMELLDAVWGDPSWGERAIEYHHWFLQQFPDVGELTHNNFTLDLAKLYCDTGQYETGEKMLQDFIEKNPANPGGYAFYSDVLGWPHRSTGRTPDLRRALEIFEQAMAYPVEDPNSYDIPARIDDLKKMIKKTG